MTQRHADDDRFDAVRRTRHRRTPAVLVALITLLAASVLLIITIAALMFAGW